MPSPDEVYPRRSVRGTLPRLYVCNMYVGMQPSAASFDRSLFHFGFTSVLVVLVGKN